MGDVVETEPSITATATSTISAASHDTGKNVKENVLISVPDEMAEILSNPDEEEPTFKVCHHTKLYRISQRSYSFLCQFRQIRLTSSIHPTCLRPHDFGIICVPDSI